MSWPAAPLQALLVMLVIAHVPGCSQPSLLLAGIGDAPYVAGETEQRVASAAMYFNAMCVRAGLPSEVAPDGQRRCLAPDDKATWEAIVGASFNDIDERCSAYLSTLDRARRDRSYFTKKLSETTRTSKIALDIAETGPTALTVLEAIFGYAQSSLETYYSRLILETEKGAVERIVLRLQNAYRQYLREKLSSRGEEIDGSSGAYYAVRGYLRLCLPATIEAEVGSTLNKLQYSGTDRTSLRSSTPVLASIEAIPMRRSRVRP